MNQDDLARLVERSEAQAYASLLQCRSETLAHGDFGAARVGGAWAMFSPAVTSSLNFNRVIGLGMEQPAQPRDLEAIVQFYAARQLSFAIESGPYAKPGSLPDWMRQRRIRRGLPTAMYCMRATPMTQSQERLRIARVMTTEERSQVAEICCSVFRMPAPVKEQLIATGKDSRWRAWLAWSGQEPVAAALSFVDEQLAWLGWDATLPQHRGLGAHRALIAARVWEAHASDCEHVTTETAAHTAAAADPSGRNYEKMGFVLVQHRHTYVAIRSPASAVSHRSEVRTEPDATR